MTVMEIATSAVSCQRLQWVPVGVQTPPPCGVTREVGAAFVSVTQPLHNFQGGQALRDHRSELGRWAACGRHPGGQDAPAALVLVLAEPERGGPHEEEVPRKCGLFLLGWRPLLVGGSLLPLVPEDGGEAGVGGRAGAFALAGLEEVLVIEVVQEVVVLVGEVVVVLLLLWRCCGTCRAVDVSAVCVWGPFTEDLLDLSLNVGGLSPSVEAIV